jgi:phosphopentomutase
MEDKGIEMNSLGVVELPGDESKETTNRDQQEMAYFGKAQQLKAGSSTWSSI